MERSGKAFLQVDSSQGEPILDYGSIHVLSCGNNGGRCAGVLHASLTDRAGQMSDKDHQRVPAGVSELLPCTQLVYQAGPLLYL